MKINEFNNKPTTNAKKALNEHFSTNVNFNALGLYETQTMLRKIRGLLSEMRQSSNSISSERNPNYLKLVFMEEGLSHRYGELKALPIYNQRIIVENEKIQQSQVLLAANEMVDSMQKMIEQISDMLVKELPAVKQGINAEFGTDEGENFSQQASQALAGLQGSLTQAKSTLETALNAVTDGVGAGGDMGGMPSDMGADMSGMGDEVGDEGGLPAEEPSDTTLDAGEEEETTPDLGRQPRL
jgi:hypothetical protein